jgi:hypothetical protein
MSELAPMIPVGPLKIISFLKQFGEDLLKNKHKSIAPILPFLSK